MQAGSRGIPCKHSLLMTALRRYQQVVGDAIQAQLFQGGPVRAQIAGLFREVIQQQFTTPLHRGCFIVNSATELAPADTEVARLLEQIGDDLHAAFVTAIAAGQRRGGLSYQHAPEAMSRFLFITYCGLMVQARQAPAPEGLEEALDIALSVLDR